MPTTITLELPWDAFIKLKDPEVQRKLKEKLKEGGFDISDIRFPTDEEIKARKAKDGSL